MSSRSVTTLIYPVRGRVLGKYFGQLCFSLAAMVAAPLAVAVATGELGLAWRYATLAILYLAGALSLGRLRAPAGIQTNEALVITALVFIIGALGVAWTFTACGLAPLDALFEAISAITTTGLSTVTALPTQTPTFLFTRAWVQWYGGLVIVVLAVAILLEPGIVARRFAAGDVDTEDLVGSTRQRAERVLVVYLTLTVVGFVLLWGSGVAPFSALLHVLAAVSTGGFSPYENSIAGFASWWSQAAVTLVSLAGAVSFSLYYRLWWRRWRVALDRDVLALIAAGLAVSVLLAAFMKASGHYGLRQVLANAPLLAFSAQTTTGFSTLPVADLDPASKLVLVVSMLVGGDNGSTAGGIKIVRLLMLLSLLRFVIHRSSLPRHAVAQMDIGERRLEHSDMHMAIAIILLFVGVVLISWLAFLALGYPALDSLFETASALATTGLSTGVTSASLHPLLKGVLCFDMLAGRVEIVALLILLYPRTWFGERGAST